MKKVCLISVSVVIAVLVLLLAAIPLVVPAMIENAVRAKLGEFGLAADVGAGLGYRWRSGPSLAGHVDAAIPGSPWRLRTDYALSCCGATATVHMARTSFSQDDPVLRKFLGRYPLKGITNLCYSGAIALDATVSASPFHLTPQWDVHIPLRDISASANGDSLKLDSLSLTVDASGIGRHFNISPLRVRAKSFASKEIALDDVRANLIVSERSLMLTDATARFCGGTASIYALKIDLATLNTGFTFLLDDVEAGEALSYLRGFRGSASGRLHGKVRLFLRQGGESLRLSEAFLYSVPGETGKIRLKNPDEFTERFALSGLDSETCRKLAFALTDLDYSVLRLDLTRDGGKDTTLSTRIAGTARRGEMSVPVDVTVNLHGELEQFVNLGLEYSSKMKGKQP